MNNNVKNKVETDPSVMTSDFSGSVGPILHSNPWWF